MRNQSPKRSPALLVELQSKARQLIDELIEVGLCYLISSRMVEHVVASTKGMVVSNILIELRHFQDLLGLFKVVGSFLLFAGLRLLRLVVCRLAKTRNRTIGNIIQSMRRPHGTTCLYFMIILYSVCSMIFNHLGGTPSPGSH